MKKRTKANINAAILATIISIPIIIGKVRATENLKAPEASEPKFEVETETEEIEVPKWVPSYDYSFIEKVEETEPETKQVFKAYDFIPFSEDFQAEIFKRCKKHNFDFDYLLAVMKTESDFRWIIGDDGESIGYMQIQPRWWQRLADEEGLNIIEPADNVELGIIIIEQLLIENNGWMPYALKQYNSGNPHFESDAYVNKVHENIKWIADMKEGE